MKYKMMLDFHWSFLKVVSKDINSTLTRWVFCHKSAYSSQSQGLYFVQKLSSDTFISNFQLRALCDRSTHFQSSSILFFSVYIQFYQEILIWKGSTRLSTDKIWKHLRRVELFYWCWFYFLILSGYFQDAKLMKFEAIEMVRTLTKTLWWQSGMISKRN